MLLERMRRRQKIGSYYSRLSTWENNLLKRLSKEEAAQAQLVWGFFGIYPEKGRL